MKKQECIRCVNDQTVKNISFNQDGLCSYCQSFDKYYDKFTDYEKLKNIFLNKINLKGDYRYDAAVGFSGGKDSTYVLYKLVKEYKLNVIAYTLDNGFLSQEAKDKIDRIVKELGVVHEYVECDMSLLKKMYKVITTKYLSPCIACSFLGYAVMINYASKVNAKVGIHGRSFYQMFRTFQEESDDYFKPFINASLEENVNLNDLYRNVLSKIEKLVDKNLAKQIKDNILGDAYQKGFREFIGYFFYHPYHKDKIIQFLEKNTSWKVETEEEHFDCMIHNGSLYLKNLCARRHHQMPEFSVMVRMNHITKEQAKKLMATEVDKETAKKEIKVLCKFAGIRYHKLILKTKLYSKRWW